MRYFLVAGMLSAALLAAGCSKQTDEELFQRGMDNQRIDNVEEALEAYQQLLEEYPQSPKVPEALYALGGLYQNTTHDYPRAIDMYRRVAVEFPDHATASSASFLIGFIYNNELKDTAAARTAYSDFLKKYPSSPMVSSATFELEHLGEDPSVILQNASQMAQGGSAKDTKKGKR